MLAAGAPQRPPLSPTPGPVFAASECVYGVGVGVGGPLLVLLFAMRDDVTQVPIVQIATHIWRESSKHLLDLGKEPGVSLNQGRGGGQSQGSPKGIRQNVAPLFGEGGIRVEATEARPAGQDPTHPCSHPRSQGGHHLSGSLKKEHFPGRC